MNWQTIISGNDSRRWVRGAELERCLPAGFRSRFAIYSVRTIAREMFEGKEHIAYDVKYRVRDVEAANDAHFREGKPAPIFGEFDTLDAALLAIEPHRVETNEGES